MGGMILFIFYGSIVFCMIATVIKIARYTNAPLHLRWELYREGSVYESPDGWNRDNLTFWRKLKSVILDISFLREFYHRNRKFWIFLYTFHVGIYLLILWHGWLFLRAVLIPLPSFPVLGLVWGHGATALAFIGGCGILIKRIIDEDLRVYYPSIHYVKWIFMLLTLLGAFYAVTVHFNAEMSALLKYVKEQVTFQDFQHKLHPAPAPALHVLFASVWLIYFPFSHILQLFFRYYHHLRWDDVPNVRGSTIEKRVKDLLDQPITWSGPHIQSGKTWRQVAAEVQDTTEVQGR